MNCHDCGGRLWSYDAEHLTCRNGHRTRRDSVAVLPAEPKRTADWLRGVVIADTLVLAALLAERIA